MEAATVEQVDRLGELLGEANKLKRVDVVAVDDGSQHVGAEVGRVHLREPAAPLAYWSPDGVDDEGLGHSPILSRRRDQTHLRGEAEAGHEPRGVPPLLARGARAADRFHPQW